MSSRQLIKGTIILTLAGIFTKIIGFIYKIFLSNTIGAINLGIYQLVFPVYIICHTIYASGIQTALSKSIASQKQNDTKLEIQLLYHAIFISIMPAIILSITVYASSHYIANRLLFEPQCEQYLKIIAFIFPFCSITSCINGYYYGKKSTKVPAIAQMLEQIFRTLIVIIIVYFSMIDNSNGCIIAIIGLVSGELISCIYTSFSIKNPQKVNFHPQKKLFHTLFYTTLYLTINRLLINVLSAIETTLIPFMLRRNGLSTSDSLYTYGTLFGMSIPIIMFPSTITTAFAIMLLPEISQDYSKGRIKKICNTVNNIVKITNVIGIFALTILFFFGRDLGIIIFNNKDSGIYMQALCVLCPFIYISSSFTSILNGLDKTVNMLINSVIGLSIRILGLILLVPKYGIWIYIISLIISELVMTLLDFFTIKTVVGVNINWFYSLLFPLIISFIIFTPIKKLYVLFIKNNLINKTYSIISLLLLIIVGFFIYSFLIIRNKHYDFVRSIGKHRSSF